MSTVSPPSEICTYVYSISSLRDMYVCLHSISSLRDMYVHTYARTLYIWEEVRVTAKSVILLLMFCGMMVTQKSLFTISDKWSFFMVFLPNHGLLKVDVHTL